MAGFDCFFSIIGVFIESFFVTVGFRFLFWVGWLLGCECVVKYIHLSLPFYIFSILIKIIELLLTWLLFIVCVHMCVCVCVCREREREIEVLRLWVMVIQHLPTGAKELQNTRLNNCSTPPLSNGLLRNGSSSKQNYGSINEAHPFWANLSNVQQ